MLLALIEEYKRAAINYKKILKTLPQATFEAIKDATTTDPDCHSIQTVTFHIVQSGHTYANYINTIFKGEWREYTTPIQTPQEGIAQIDAMLAYTEHVLADKWQLNNEELTAYSFDARWGMKYDVEQLFEHAIVHILRHRRQIENFLK